MLQVKFSLTVDIIYLKEIKQPCTIISLIVISSVKEWRSLSLFLNSLFSRIMKPMQLAKALLAEINNLRKVDTKFVMDISC